MLDLLTIAIPTLNDAVQLRQCLEALEFGAELEVFAWNGKFPKKRNWFLRTCAISTPWILFLDADEFVTPAFLEELRRELPVSTHAGYWLKFDNEFLGGTLRYGDTMRKLALFRVGAGEYEKIEEESWSHLDMEVHEHPVLEGSIGEIDARLTHRDYRGIGHWVAKHNAYSDWECRRWEALVASRGSIDARSDWEGLNDRQQRKYSSIHRWWFAPAYAASCLFLKRGFLDGRRGFIFAALKGWYFWLIRQKIRELPGSSGSGAKQGAGR